jgi:ribosomal-protein-alanine N-acetyltransferase
VALEATLARGRERKCTLATLEVRRSNEAALNLYKGFGFRAVGIRPNYYADEGEDAIVMVLDL